MPYPIDLTRQRQAHTYALLAISADGFMLGTMLRLKVAGITGAIMATTDLQKRVEQVKCDLDTPVQGPAEAFADKLKKATQLRAGKARTGVTASNVDSFERKLVDTTKRFAASRARSRPLQRSANR
jgi:hypothetical protein